MMFAQTGLNSASTSNDLPSDAPASSSLWWLIGLTFAFVGLALYIRRQLNRREQPATKVIIKGKTSRKEEQKAPPVESSVNFTSTKSRDIIPSKKAAKKSKKVRSTGERQGKTIVSHQTESKSNLPNSSDLAPSLLPANPSPTIPPSTIPPQIVAPVTTAAIFEPLRDVGPKRRSPTFSPQLDSLKPNEEFASSQPNGGKFERTVAPMAATRSVANRWPSTATQQVRSNVVAPQRPQEQPLPPSNSVVDPAPVPAPAKGLASFVSKVKSSVAYDSVSSSVDVETTSKK